MGLTNINNSDIMSFYQTYGNYQVTADPYHHLRTTSRGSQNYSPTYWTQTGTFDIANYHDYMRSHYGADLANDEVNFVQRFAWCLGTKGTYCSGLGLQSGTWTGDYKPWVWGEIDVDDGTWYLHAQFNNGPVGTFKFNIDTISSCSGRKCICSGCWT